MRWLVGTSGFGYREWKGRFYPRGLKESEQLAYYAARYAFEFRNPSWFDAEIAGLLKRKPAALCLNDADVEGCPLIASAPFGVLKLRKLRYRPGELARRLRQAEKLSWRETFVFFKHEATASGPKLAARWLRLVSAGKIAARGQD